MCEPNYKCVFIHFFHHWDQMTTTSTKNTQYKQIPKMHRKKYKKWVQQQTKKYTLK